MELRRKLFSGATEALAENRQVVVVISTGDVDRQGDIVEQDGIALDAYQANPVVLWQHDPMQPIARCLEIGIASGVLRALVQFPPEGTSAKADEVYGLIRAGVVNAASIGFLPIDAEPLDTKQPWAGQRFLKSELMEFSFVSVPANRGATVVGRSAAAEEADTPQTDVADQSVAVCSAGKVLSAANQKLLQKAMEHYTSAAEHHKAAGECIKAVLDTAGDFGGPEDVIAHENAEESAVEIEKAALRRRLTALRIRGEISREGT